MGMHIVGGRLYLFASQVFFTAALAPLFLWPKVGGSRPVRSFVAFSFGRLLAPRYSRVISSFGELYGVALDEGLNFENSSVMVELSSSQAGEAR